ncbi:MAG: VWA domain-containing protein [Armatimonadetes bacterium]|nr:VWA domain-containing protein [Armatimonadota bacterium]
MLFGQPQFLPLLALASLPLLIHLLARRQRKIVKFSMTRFLQEVAQQTQGRKWLRELLLLLLRTGSIFFALLTLLRPYAPVPLPLPPAPTSIAIVLDNSLSMQGKEQNDRIWFERALKWCEQAMENLPAEIALLAADNASEPICDFTEDLQQRLKAIKGVRPTFKALDLTPALQTADNLLARLPSAVKKVVVVTDLQSEPFRSLNFPSLKNPVLVVDVKSSEGIGNVRLNAKLQLPLDPNTDGSIICQLENLSAQKMNGTIVALASGKPFTRTKISLQPQTQVDITLPLPSWVLESSDEKGLVQVEVRWHSELDILSWDDFLRFAFKSPKQIRAINAVREGRQFVDAALRATNISPVATANFQNADVVITSPPTNPKMAQSLAEWVRQGRVALIVSDSFVSPFWSMVGVSTKRVEQGEKLRVQWVDEINPILKGLGASLQAVRAQPSLSFQEGQRNLKTLASLSDGTPFLVEFTFGLGRCFILTTSLNPQRTTLIYSPAFVPLLYRLVRFATHGQELSAIEAESKPKATPKNSTVVPKSESDFRLPTRKEVEGKLSRIGGAIVSTKLSPNSLLSETKLRDLTNLSLLLALFCLLTETALTLLWWRRIR